MSEIEKMYKNAHIKAKEYCDRDSDACMSCCPEWENRQDCWKYKSVIPSFTAEKQLELIKKISPSYPLNYHLKCFQGYSFEEGLAKCINNLWECLSEEEKQQVKEILK